jgi:hypothetical protein
MMDSNRLVAMEVIKTLEAMFKRMDDLSRYLMSHTDQITLSILQNMRAKRVITASRDLFLAFKSVYTSESLAEKLLKQTVLSEENQVKRADIIALMINLLKSTNRGFKLIKPAMSIVNLTITSL